MKNKQTSNFPPLFWCHVQYVFVQICLSCFIMSRVKQAGEGILFGTGDVKNNYLHWSVIFPNEAGNVSGFRATGARLGYFFFFYLVSKHVCQSTAPRYEEELSGDGSLASFPLSNQCKQTVSGCKDDSALSERTSEGPLQGDGEWAPHSFMFPLSH